MYNMNKRLLSKIYKDYGINFYPQKFKKKFKFDKKFSKPEKKIFYKNNRKYQKRNV